MRCIQHLHLAALVLLSMLAGCGEKTPHGVNYISGNAPVVILNEQTAKWHLLVDGKDLTDAAGLKVTPLKEDPQLSLAKSYEDRFWPNAEPRRVHT